MEQKKNMIKCDKKHIIKNLHMIYISSNNIRHPVTKNFPQLHNTSPNYTSLHFTTLSFGLTQFKFPIAPFHFTSLHFTTLHYTSPHFTS